MFSVNLAPRRRRRPWLIPLGALLVLVLLAGGIWLGGHPDYLPSSVRDTLLSDDDSAVYDEAADIIQEDYYRKVDRKQLLNKALGSAVDSLDDRFSAYFDPKAYRSFEEATQGAFEGVGMNVEEVPRGLRVVTVFKGSPAAQGGLKPGDEIIAVGGKSLRGSSSEQATTRIKGKSGTAVTLTVVTGKQAPREVKLKRARVDVPVVESRMIRSGKQKVAYVKLSSFTSGAHGEVGKAVRRQLAQGRQGGRARPAQQRRRPPQRGGARLLDLHPRGQDRHDARALAARARLRGDRAPRSAPRSRWSCSSTASPPRRRRS